MESQNHSDNATVISRLLSYNSQLDSFGRACKLQYKCKDYTARSYSNDIYQL